MDTGTYSKELEQILKIDKLKEEQEILKNKYIILKMQDELDPIKNINMRSEAEIETSFTIAHRYIEIEKEINGINL